MEIRSFQPADEEEGITLWRHCGLLRSWNDHRKDIRRNVGFAMGEIVSMGKRLEQDDGGASSGTITTGIAHRWP